MKRNLEFSHPPVDFSPLFYLQKHTRHLFSEDVFATTTENMASHPLCTKSIQGNTWIGCSVLFNLDAVALRGSKARHNKDEIKNIIILDSSDNVIKFWHQLINALKQHAHPSEFIDKLRLLVSTLPKTNYDPLGGLTEDIEAGRSFLCSQDTYNKIRNIALTDRIVPLNIDISDKAAIESITLFLKQNNMNIDTFYISNIPQYLSFFPKHRSNKQQLAENIAQYLEPNVYILDSTRYTRLWREKFPQTMYRACHYHGVRRRSKRIGNLPE